MSKPGLLTLTIKDKSALYLAYMPFIKNGGLFIPTNSSYKLGDEVFMLLNVMGEEEKIPVAGRVIWITPKGAQGKRTAGIGVCSPELAYSYDLTGPNLRGSGVKADLRRDEPYLGYETYEFEVPVGTGQYGPVGSCFDRNWVRAVEMKESAKIVHQALDRLEKMERADVREKVPKRVKPAKGEVYSRSEAPRGQLGYFIVADGAAVNPYRVKVKSPCFTAMSIFHVLARGMYIADIIALIGSLDVVLGEIDR